MAKAPKARASKPEEAPAAMPPTQASDAAGGSAVDPEVAVQGISDVVDGDAAATLAEGEMPDDAAAQPGEQVAVFTVLSNVLHSGETIEAGGTILLIRSAFDALRLAGVVEGSWPADLPPAAS